MRTLLNTLGLTEALAFRRTLVVLSSPSSRPCSFRPRSSLSSATLMMGDPCSVPIQAGEVPAKTSSIYPAEFQHVVKGRSKRALGDFFRLTNFGINHTTLEPGSSSALAHHHLKQDEFIYVLQGTLTLQYDHNQEFELTSGDCMGFRQGEGIAHCVVNRSKEPAVYLEVGDRTPGDTVEYPGTDLRAVNKDGKWHFLRKDGSPY